MILTTKKLTTTLLMLLFVTTSLTVKAQEENNLDGDQAAKQECSIKYTLFSADYKSKNYEQAFENWLWTFENCPSLSLGVYQMGMKMAQIKYKNAEGAEKEAAKDLIIRIYEQRLEQNFKKDSPADVYSKYALFMHKAKADETIVYNLLQKAYDIKPESMGIKQMYIYFKGFINRNKDTNIQGIFNKYDNLVSVVEKKVINDSKSLNKLKLVKETGGELTGTQKKNLVSYTKRLELYGNMEDDFGIMLEKYATCDRLIPMYEKEFDEKSTDIVWLKRSVSRLYNKECTDGLFYDKLVEQYVNEEPSSDAFVFYAGILMKKGKETKALDYFKRAVDLETDSYKKSKYLYTIAQMMKKKGNFSQARSYAYQAVNERTNFGKAHLLVASMYAKSAKSCGNGDVFKTRMVYQAALNRAKQAKAIDPSITRIANRHINSYKSKAPTTEDIFNEGAQSGSSYKLGCWIGESVRIP